MNLNSYRDLCGRAAEENGWHNGYKDALTFDSMRAVTDHMLILMKVSRLVTSPDKLDNYIDIAGYAALGAEL